MHLTATPVRSPAFAYIPARRQAIVFDTETTGVSRADRVVSLAAIPLDAGLQPSGPGVHLVFNPGRPSHPMARATHGLADAFEDAVLAMHVLHRLHHAAEPWEMPPLPFQNTQ